MTSVDFTDRLRALLSGADAATYLGRYFDVEELHCGAAAFTGSRFEHLDGGGDRAGIVDTVTAADLIAIQTLSVHVPPSAALALLEGDPPENFPLFFARYPPIRTWRTRNRLCWGPVRRPTGPGAS